MCIFGDSEKPSLAQDINANFIIIIVSTTSGDISLPQVRERQPSHQDE